MRRISSKLKEVWAYWNIHFQNIIPLIKLNSFYASLIILSSSLILIIPSSMCPLNTNYKIHTVERPCVLLDVPRSLIRKRCRHQNESTILFLRFAPNTFHTLHSSKLHGNRGEDRGESLRGRHHSMEVIIIFKLTVAVNREHRFVVYHHSHPGIYPFPEEGNGITTWFIKNN